MLSFVRQFFIDHFYLDFNTGYFLPKTTTKIENMDYSSSNKENNDDAALFSSRPTRSGSNRENNSSGFPRRILPDRSTRANLTNLENLKLRERSTSSSSSGSRSSPPIFANLRNIKVERPSSPAESTASWRTSSTEGPPRSSESPTTTTTTANGGVNRPYSFRSSRNGPNFYKPPLINKRRIKKEKSSKSKLSRVSETESSEESSKHTSSSSSNFPLSLSPRGPSIEDDLLNETDSEEFPRKNMMLMLDNIPTKPPPRPTYYREEFEVERILLRQKRGNLTYFFIKWKGYGLDEITWQSKKDLNCEFVMQIFEERRELCQKIFDSLPNPEEYPGFNDIYNNGIVTPSFMEQNTFENGLVGHNQINGFAQTTVENWTRSTSDFPKVEFIAECLFSYAANLEVKKLEFNEITCECGDACDPETCDCLENNLTCRGFIRATENVNGVTTRECHKNCSCSNKCPANVFRKGRVTTPVMLFKTPKCGWSVRTMVNIPKGRFVIEYVGIIKLYEECHGIDDITYLFDLDGENNRAPKTKTKYVIDATEVGNESRFINHNCDPNLNIASVFGYHCDPALPRIAFYSSRDIKAGEELTFNYFPYELNPENVKAATTRCYCGAENCRQYLT